MDHARIMHKPHRLALDESANLSDLRLFLFWSKVLRSRLVSERFDGQLSNLVDNSPSVLHSYDRGNSFIFQSSTFAKVVKRLFRESRQHSSNCKGRSTTPSLS